MAQLARPGRLRKGEKANSADRGYFVDDAEFGRGISRAVLSRAMNRFNFGLKYLTARQSW
jgi:hypothetical protein